MAKTDNHNDKWYKHQKNINQIYQDLIKYQNKHPEIDLSQQIGCFNGLLHGDLIDSIGTMGDTIY